MAISVVEILGTDSISASRLVINDNFNVVKNEINEIENYIDPDTGEIEGLSSLTTDALVVGTTSTILNVTGTDFTINSDMIINGDIEIRGHIFKNDIFTTTITADAVGASSYDIGSSTAVPSDTIYRVGNSAVSSTTPFVLNLYGGEIGQEIFFTYEAGFTSTVSIVEAGSVPIVVGTGYTQIDLDNIGDTVHLMCITNNSGSKEWYIVGGNGYTRS